MLSSVRADVRYAFRTLRGNPGFAAAAIAPIALGIGINTGVFSILNSVAWRPLPVPDPVGLVSIHQDARGWQRRTVYGARALFSIPEYRAYRDQTRSLSGLMAFSRHWTVTLGRESPQEIDGILVTCNYFDVLGVSAAVGPGFTPANCGRPEAPPGVVLSHALWRRAFSGDPRILEAPIVLNGREVAVTGIAPAGFDGIDMARVTFFAPTSLAGLLRPDLDLAENPHVSWLTLVGRLAKGADAARARADLALVAAGIDRQQPGRTTSVIVEPAAALSLPVQRREVLRGAAIVMAAFGLVLVVASANVANILLARGVARTREIAIRVSLGATRGRIVRQLLVENAVIACAGAASGWLLFSWSFQAAIPVLLASIPFAEPFRVDATPDRTVFWFALGLTTATALVCGLVPALQASRGDVHVSIRQDAAGSGVGRTWLRAALVGTQIAVCTMLLVPTGVLLRALYAAQTLDPGFDVRGVAAVSIDLRGPRYEQGGAARFHDDWLERVGALPGVESIALASRMPLSPGRSQTTFRVGDQRENHVADVNVVSPGFFATVGIPIVRGRVFDNAERDAVVVTESTARRYWPGQDALGRAIVMDGNRRQVVGIARDARVSQSDEALSSYVYVPARRGAQRSVSVVARTRGSFDGFAAAVRAETSGLDPGLVVRVQPLSDNVALLRTLSRITAGVAGTLSLLALGLAAIGVYGVVAFVVSRRLREIGVRMALGAGVAEVQRLILGQTLRPVAAGLAVGAASAAALVRLLGSVLFGISAYDPAAFVGGPVLMLAIAAAAALVPTRRATRLNPVSVLRSE